MSAPHQATQDELLRLFFSSTSATSVASTPPPIVSPYPASSYTRYTSSKPPPSPPEQKESVTFLTPSSSSSPTSTSSLFTSHPLLSPHQTRQLKETEKRKKRHHTLPLHSSSAEWNKPLTPTLHLPILQSLLTTSPSTPLPPPSLPSLTSPLTTVYQQSSHYENSLSLHTSNDAIAYFSRLPTSSPIKFLYANPLPSTPSLYLPYDLTIVDRKHINPSSYYTISTHGIVHITSTPPSPPQTESTSLSDWVHQSSMFTLLRSIRFFRHFLVTKLFRLWKANVRFRVFCHARRRLANSLFVARPSFCSALMEVGEVMSEIRGVGLTSVRVGQVYSVETFGKEQGEVRQVGVKRVEQWVERVEEILEGVCKGVKDRARLYDHRIANEELSNSRFAQHLLGDKGSDGGGKVKSMVKMKQEKSTRLKQLQHANREADMLGDFVRLIDVIEVETLVGKCIDNTAEFLTLLLSSTKPLFATSVSFASQGAGAGLVFTPTSSDLSSLLTSLSDLTIGAVDGLSRVISHPKFLPLLGGGKESGLRVGQVVHDDRGYERMMEEMSRRIVQGFVGVNDSVKFLEKHRGVWEYGEQVKQRQANGLPPDDDTHTPDTSTPISSLTSTLTGLTKWSQSLQHIRDLYSSGLIQADCRSLKLTLLPITEQAIHRKRKRMVQLFIEGVETVMTNYQHYQAQLKDDPLLLSQYVDYVRTVQSVKANEKQLRASLVRELDSLHALMVSHDVYNANWVATSDQVRFDEMKETSALFTITHQSEADAKLESKWEEMKGKVMSEIKRYESSIDQLIRQMDENVVYSDYTVWGGVGAQGVKEVLAQLEVDGKKIRDVTKKTEEMQRQQVVLEETAHVFKGLQVLGEKWDKKRGFFGVVEQFKEREKKFWSGELEKVDLSTMDNEVKAMDQIAVQYPIKPNPEKSTGGTMPTVKESERSAEVVKREMEMIKNFRVDLSFYTGFLATISDLQKIHHKLGQEQYKHQFIGFGHFKRMKDLKKVDWTQYKPLIAQKLDELNLL